MRDYSRFDENLSRLMGDVYEQPEDKGHRGHALRLCVWALSNMEVGSVLDVGCGNGFCQSFLYDYTGIGLGDDIRIGKSMGRNVREMDFNFLDFPDESFNTVFSRHSLEHSPFPVLTLMEWHRVARKNLILCVPNPFHYTYVGRNHYSVANAHQTAWWLRRAGWRIFKARKTQTEFWFLCHKNPIIGYEGWAAIPLPAKVYEFERDLFKKDTVETPIFK